MYRDLICPREVLDNFKIKKLDQKMKGCFLTAGEMYYGPYSDIFSSLPANCFIRKPISNEELLKHIDEVMYGAREIYY